tara:strand:- start:155 stop:859 length:705 start_codon:yes stop_codon:yes gene_type:complete
MTETPNTQKDILLRSRKSIRALKKIVTDNKAALYQSRAIIEENRMMILSNYTANFMGNRQLINQNTDDVFSASETMLDALDPQTESESVAVEIFNQSASLDFLSHRSSLTSSVIQISEQMAEVNARLISINREIMETNTSIIAFNKKQIERNKGYSNNESVLHAATDEMNERLIDENNQKIEEINISATHNSEEIANLLHSSMENRSRLISNKDEISAARNSILENRELILKST